MQYSMPPSICKLVLESLYQTQLTYVEQDPPFPKEHLIQLFYFYTKWVTTAAEALPFSVHPNYIYIST